MSMGRTGSKYQDLGRIMEFLHDWKVFHDWKVWQVRNAIIEAVNNQKYFLHWRRRPGYPVECLGFCTYAFLTRKEIEEDSWQGEEVFAREEGEVFYFPTFVCNGGKKEIYRFANSIRNFIWENYPGVETCESYRSKLNGFDRMQLWKVNQPLMNKEIRYE
jgi:hemolysin-activating ACP:hemolysin acyltransferase